MRWTAYLVAALIIVAGCTHTKVNKPAAPQAPPPVTFEDVTQHAGIRFVHTNGATGKKYMPETMGSGCAFLDFDNDGWLDILLVNGTQWPGSAPGSGLMKLYRNDHHGGFIDVTTQAGLNVPIYGMGVAVGDFDNDGFDDIFVTGVGRSFLFHNEPAGSGRRFRDVTSSAGVSSSGWATSATWIDYDRDGKLDLFVCHYVQWTPATNGFFSIDGVHPSYATPEHFHGETCRLYHNQGGGRFRDVTREAGIYNEHSKALGAVAFDYDQDGWPDLIVSNDTEPNFLFHNQGDGTFKEVALESGIALNEQGKAKAGMGVDIGDDRNDGQESIAITNFSGEQLSLFRREPGGHYLDEAARSGIGNVSQLYLGFGVLYLDYDGDGRQDLFVANGHIQGDIDMRGTGVIYREPALLMRNLGGGRFMDVTASTGAALQTPQIGRGAAWGDFDNDGRPDLLLATNYGDPTQRLPTDGRARLLHNVNRTGNHWLRLRLEGVQSNRDAFGARVRIRAGGLTQTMTVKAGNSYLSQSDRRLLFGLGAATKVDSAEVLWPIGQLQPLGPLDADTAYVVREGAAPVRE